MFKETHTKAQVVAAVAATGLIAVWSAEWNEWRITFRVVDMPDATRREEVACYTDDNEDAIDTAWQMQKWGKANGLLPRISEKA